MDPMGQCARSQTKAFHSTIMAYGKRKACQTTHARCSIDIFLLVCLVVTEKPYRPIMQTKPNCGYLVPTPMQQSLPYNKVEHPSGVGLWSYARLLPLSGGACPTVHRPTSVNPKRSTLPRPLPICQRATVRWRSSVLRRPRLVPPPLLMAHSAWRFTIPPPTQASPTQIVARCLPAVHLSKGTLRWRSYTFVYYGQRSRLSMTIHRISKQFCELAWWFDGATAQRLRCGKREGRDMQCAKGHWQPNENGLRVIALEGVERLCGDFVEIGALK